MLGSMVGGSSARSAHSGYRHSLYDMAVCFLLKHNWDYQLHKIYVAHQIGMYDPFPIADRHVPDVSEQGDSSIVHQKIDLSVCFDSLRYCILGVFKFCDIRRNTYDFGTNVNNLNIILPTNHNILCF